MIAPVTSATVESSNSSLRLVKSGFRSTTREDRLNTLLLLFIHKDIALDYDTIVDDYAKRNPAEKDDIYQSPAMNVLMVVFKPLQ